MSEAKSLFELVHTLYRFGIADRLTVTKARSLYWNTSERYQNFQRDYLSATE